MIVVAIGTRPEYIKVKPLIEKFKENNIEYKVLFVKQHTDILNDIEYDESIEVENGYNRLDSIIKSVMNKISSLDWNIDYIMVHGDTATALAVALSAYNHNIKLIHLEAGLRTYDRNNPYPEETNRVIIDYLSSILFAPTKRNYTNLLRDRNISLDHDVHVVGNTIIDNLVNYKDECEYTNKILITLHRRENHHWLDQWFKELNELSILYPNLEFILPLHPNPNVQKHKNLLSNINIIDPLSYDKMLDLIVKTRLIITDSGGIQEEASFFNKKCLICRKITERPEILGTNGFYVKEPKDLKNIFANHINDFEINFNCPYGNGKTSEKIIKILKEKYL